MLRQRRLHLRGGTAAKAIFSVDHGRESAPLDHQRVSSTLRHRALTLSAALALVLVTVQDDALTKETHAAALLERIIAHPGVRVLPLQRLSEFEQRELVHDLLGLSGELADEVQARSDGSPLFAVEVLEELVNQGSLELANGEFRLKSGCRAELPENVKVIWSRRLDEVLSAREPRDTGYLRLAAALGKSVVMIERGIFGGTCVNTGCVPSKALIAAAEARHTAADTARFPGIATTAGPVDMAALIAGTHDLVESLRSEKYLNVAESYGWQRIQGQGQAIERGRVATNQRQRGQGAGEILTRGQQHGSANF